MSTNVPIASVTLSAATSSVTFSGIPQTYTDLVLVCSFQNTASVSTGDVRIVMQFNDDTSSNYSITSMWGNGSTSYSATEVNRAQIDNIFQSATSNTSEFGTMFYHIMNYKNTSTYKSVLFRQNTTSYQLNGSGAGAGVGLWRSTTAISSITLKNRISSELWSAGSTFNLYGIASGGPKAFGGDTVTTDGTYYYHTFRSSGTFTPTQALSVDYLVVAGGGGSDKENGGGGGAGGLRSTVTATGGGGPLESPLSLASNTNYTVTIGAGGAASGLNAGSNSVFATITSIGGGYGGDGAGGSGGSGGGAGGDAGTASGGAGTANQGYAGGSATAQTRAPSAGGGGAGAVGANNASSQGGNGGVGVATSISGSSVYYAGGGGGGVETGGTAGTGGNGGGGDGAASNGASPTNGTVNKGGGAGGSSGGQGSPGAQGGSGIVIVRYPV